MAREIQKHLPDFTEEENILGWAGHVKNLAAVACLKALGHKKSTTLWKTMRMVATMILRKMRR